MEFISPGFYLVILLAFVGMIIQLAVLWAVIRSAVKSAVLDADLMIRIRTEERKEYDHRTD